MTQTEIHNRVQEIFKQKNELDEELRKIRTHHCQHVNEILVNYSWRPGDIRPAYICNDCHMFLYYAAENEFPNYSEL